MQNDELKSELPAQPSDNLRDVDSTRLLAALDSAVNNAFEAGYIHGHNDTVEGCFNLDTGGTAIGRSKPIRDAVHAYLSANTGLLVVVAWSSIPRRIVRLRFNDKNTLFRACPTCRHRHVSSRKSPCRECLVGDSNLVAP